MTLSRRTFVVGAMSALSVAACRAKSDAPGAEPPVGPLLSPADLAARLSDVAAGKMVVFYVGPDALFAKGHVPGARKLPALDGEGGGDALTKALASVPAATDIVLYCGCCPVRNCPNVRPASAALRASGRSNAHVLDLPTRFTTDWVDKGFAVERG
ncbi:MAG: hypothetical protein U0169_10820 [Polyangiaceae bacterium]